MKIFFLIRSLNAGGAERQLILTAKGLKKQGYDIIITTFYTGDFYELELKNSNIRLLTLNKKGRWDIVTFYLRLIKLLIKEHPDIIYSFMSIANIFTVLCKPFIKKHKLIWGVRASNIDLNKYDWLSRWSYKLECLLSHFANITIANSYAGRDHAIANGFPENKVNVIHNGIDTDYFKKNIQAKERMRKQWKINNDIQIVGLVGRIEPIKGYPIFLQAASILKQKNNNLRFVCIGDGTELNKVKLKTLATELNLNDVLIWTGRQRDMLGVYNALDILCSASYGEGFSNVIAESMACGIPCVVTNVGDSAKIISNTECKLVEAQDSQAMAYAIDQLLQLPTESIHKIKHQVREKIVSNYNVEALIQNTQKKLYSLFDEKI